MNVKQTLKNKLLSYPTLYRQDIWKCAAHMFCVNGAGYFWNNGELVDCTEERVPLVCYTTTAWEDISKYLSPFEQKVAKLAEADMELIVEEYAAFDPMIFNFPLGHYELYPSVNFCNFMQVPTDVNDDWLEFAIEFGFKWERSVSNMENSNLYTQSLKLITSQLNKLIKLRNSRKESNAN